MHIHILGICGTFMGGVAKLGQELGFQVTGMDAHVYPPMSDQLTALGIDVVEGFEPSDIPGEPDMYVIGNAMSRGNPCVEYILEHQLPYTSGPQWLAEHVLRDKWVIAVAGTHGKTTTSSMITWLLEATGMEPGYLIGGVANNFAHSATLGGGHLFVIEADEYDSAFFDKRSKFVHYHPRTCVLNNLEYDHADIFPDIDAIIRQFHHLLRTVPKNGLIIAADDDANLAEVLEMGRWTPLETFAINDGTWSASLQAIDASEFTVHHNRQKIGDVSWSMLGEHNVKNALAALAAVHHAGVAPEEAIAAFHDFAGVKRRLEVRGVINGVTIYDDFAHHPTAIAATLSSLRKNVGAERIIAVLDFASNSMQQGAHNDAICSAIQDADEIHFLHAPREAQHWGIEQPFVLHDDVDDIVEQICSDARANDHVLIMSNKSIGNLPQKLLTALER